MSSGGRFSSLLLEGLDEYRRGNMSAAVRAWEEAYTLEPTNPRAREFLHSALERIYSQMGLGKKLPPLNGPPPPKPGAESSERQRAQEPNRQQPAPPQPTPVVSDLEVLLSGARDLVAQRDFDGALELVSKVLAAEPHNAAAQRMRGDCEQNLTTSFEARLGALTQRPRVLLKPDEIRWLDLDPRAGFVLAQIDGAVSYDDLYDICGLPRLDTVRILSQLVEEKIIGPDKG
jgi:hypothetical protein